MLCRRPRKPKASKAPGGRTGWWSVRLCVAASATHGTPAETLRDYVQPHGDPEMTFIRDLFTRSTDETAERWYGGHFHATVLANYGRALLWNR